MYMVDTISKNKILDWLKRQLERKTGKGVSELVRGHYKLLDNNRKNTLNLVIKSIKKGKFN